MPSRIVADHQGRKLAMDAERNAFDTVIECTGTIEIWEQSIEHVRRGGTVVLFGGCASGTSVSMRTLSST